MPTYTTDQRTLKGSQLLSVSRETIADQLATMQPDALADLDLILEQADKIRFRSEVFEGDGITADPEAKRELLRQQARDALGISGVLATLGFGVL